MVMRTLFKVAPPFPFHYFLMPEATIILMPEAVPCLKLYLWRLHSSVGGPRGHLEPFSEQLEVVDQSLHGVLQRHNHDITIETTGSSLHKRMGVGLGLTRYLHFGPAGRHQFGIVNLDLSLWHVVETLVNDVQTLSHLFHSDQVPGSKTKMVKKRYEQEGKAPPTCHSNRHAARWARRT